jgi:hypothetical protein
MNVKWHFLTIGVGAKNFERAALRLGKEAAGSKSFASLIIETNKSLSSQHIDFNLTHSKFIAENAATGYGNYLWKPYLVNYWLNKIPDGDGLLYLDAGCTLNLKSRNKNKMDGGNRLAELQKQLSASR